MLNQTKILTLEQKNQAMEEKNKNKYMHYSSYFVKFALSNQYIDIM